MKYDNKQQRILITATLGRIFRLGVKTPPESSEEIHTLVEKAIGAMSDEERAHLLHGIVLDLFQKLFFQFLDEKQNVATGGAQSDNGHDQSDAGIKTFNA